MCHHNPSCPRASAADRLAARIVSAHPEQGWNLLCNGVVVFDDEGALLPDGRAVAPQPNPKLRLMTANAAAFAAA